MKPSVIKLTEEGVQAYWKNRALHGGMRATGCCSCTLIEQNERYKIRKEFIFTYCPKNLRTVDYGCGIGRYVGDFKYYLGIDFTESLLDIAKMKHPKAKFLLLHNSYLDCELDFDPELIFTANVLQHNPDDIVLKIFESFANILNHDITFGLYENIHAQSGHMRGRTGKEYVELISVYFKIQKWDVYTHNMNGLKIGKDHAFTLIKVGI